MDTKDKQHTMLSEIEKAFVPQQALTLYRHKVKISFTCHRCEQTKTSKLAAFEDSSPDNPFCNGCYGKILAGRPRNG